jgi:hypothetical protein
MAFMQDTTFSALHVACCYGTPTVELLQYLLQLDSSQAKEKKSSGDAYRDDHCPLGQLCFNFVKRADELPNAEDLVSCLLEVDKSKEVVGDAVCGCLEGYSEADSNDAVIVVDRRNGRLYGMIEMLLKANPEAAKYRGPDSGSNILHRACWNSLTSELCIDIVKLVLALHKDAVREADEEDQLPVHFAAEKCDVEVVEFLLGLCPEAASVATSNGHNLLHLAVGDSASSAVPKVQYLCSRYPAMIQQFDGEGEMPVHRTRNYKVAKALYEAAGIEQFRTPIAAPTADTNVFDGYLPLHLFIYCRSDSLKTVSQATTSEDAGMFRWLLWLYPEAAGIEGGVGATFKTTPYQLAVHFKLLDYYLRLLLRAAPTLDPAELHRLNYAERRMAMFLAFRAESATMEAPLLARLRGENKDLVQRVVSFL